MEEEEPGKGYAEKAAGYRRIRAERSLAHHAFATRGAEAFLAAS